MTSYTKHTWVAGELATAAKLNNIETGIENNNTDIQNLIQPITIDPNWELGSINTADGTNSSANEGKRLRTPDFHYSYTGATYYMPSGLRGCTYTYNTNATSGYIEASGWVTGTVSIPAGVYFRLVAAFSDNSDIVVTDAANAVVTVYTARGGIIDVQSNGTSVLNNGIANIPAADSNTFGVIRPNANSFDFYNGGMIIRSASESEVKAGNNSTKALTPSRTAHTAFYGLSKAAGEDMSSSSNAVGVYTSSAKTKIQQMLGIDTIVETATGSIVNFSDGADDISVRDLEVAITPIQNFNGNIWDEKWELGYYDTNGAPQSSSTNIRCKNYIMVTPNETYYMVRPSGVNIYICQYNANKELVGSRSDGSGSTFIAHPDARYIRFNLSSGYGVTYNNDIAINYPSTITTYSAYTNIRPITGWTGAKIYNDPVYGGTIYWNQLVKNGNFANTDNWSGVNGTLAVSNNKAVLTYNSGTKPRIVQQLTTSTIPNHIYLISGWVTASKAFTLRIGISSSSNGGTVSTSYTLAANTKTHVWAIESSSSALSYVFAGIINLDSGSAAESGTFTFEDFYMTDLTATFGNAVASNISTLETSTAGAGMAWFSNLFPKTYYAYNAGTETCVSAVNDNSYQYISVDWTTEAGTIYGGTLDITTGVLTATWTKQALGRTGWTNATNGNSRRYLRNFIGMGIPDPDIPNLDALCTHFERVTEAEKSTAQFGTFRISDGSYMVVYDNGNALQDNNAFMSWLDAQNTAGTPVEICYRLATPTTYQLTPQQLATFLGDNAIWANTGNTTVQYCANTKGYVDSTVHVTDVQVNGTSILNDGVANVSKGSTSNWGVFKVATDANIKSENSDAVAITPYRQHNAVFYGLAKAAGDTTQASSNNSVGTYTDEAISAIQMMLGSEFLIGQNENDASAHNSYSTGDYFIKNGYFYRALDNINETDYILPLTNCEPTTIAAELSTKLKDVQINGTSAVNNGIGNIPIASNIALGVIKVDGYGLSVNSTTGLITTEAASSANVKAGTASYKPIVPSNQHSAVFYGLAKAAGDTTQSASDNAVGTYTDTAKTKIKEMLGIETTVTLTGTTQTITAAQNTTYICDELSSLSFTPCASGLCEVIFESGSTPTTLTVPNTVTFPDWFDPSSLLANSIYEISIRNGTLGVVAVWDAQKKIVVI